MKEVEMKSTPWFIWCFRYLVSGLLVLSAAIFLGAAKVSPDRETDRMSSCREMLAGNYSELVRPEYRSSWKELLEKSPELAVRIHASGISRVNSAE